MRLGWHDWYVRAAIHGSGQTVRKQARRGFIVSGKSRDDASGIDALEMASRSLPRAIWRTLRPHQWAKNLLVLVAVVISHQFRHWVPLSQAIIAALLFCAASSSVYVWNDLLDLEADRRHRSKRLRPLAHGDLPIPLAIVVGTLLGAGALGGALLAGLPLALIIALYMAIGSAYSIWFKKLLVADVVVLACLYVLRVIAGGLASGIRVSFWTIAFALFFFFGLAMVKRYSELRNREEDGTRYSNRRAYRNEDLSQLNLLGVASGLISICIVGLYIDGPDVKMLYQHPDVLWFLCPLLLYWWSRVWLLANRGEVHEDPVVSALTDLPSYVVGVLMVLTAIAAK